MSAVVAPERSVEQRRVALQLANEVRASRAGLKREIKAGRVRLADLLTDPPEHIRTMKVLDLLKAVPKIGIVKANNLLYRCRVSPTKTVAGMSDRQRGEMVFLLLSGGTKGILRTRERRPVVSRGFCEEETAA